MKYSKWIYAGLSAGVITAATGAAMQMKGGSDDTGPYKAVANDWLKPLVAGFIDRGCSVFVESPNRIWYTTDVEFPVPPARGAGARGPGGPGARGPGAGGPPAAARGPLIEGVPADEHKPHIMILDASGNIAWRTGARSGSPYSTCRTP